MAGDTSQHRGTAIAWNSLVAHLQAGSVLDAESPRLTDYALNHFDPKAVIERLIAPEPTYFAYKDILFAGLSAWTVCPQHLSLVREAMVLAGIARMAELEQQRRNEFPQDPLLADFVSRFAGPGIDFYRDFYYPAGGLLSVLQARSPALLRKALATVSEEIDFQVELMRVCHYHAEQLQDLDVFRRASFESGSKAVADLIEQGVAPTISGYKSAINPRKQRTINAANCRKKSAP